MTVSKPLYIWSKITDILPSQEERDFLFYVCESEGIDTLFPQINGHTGLDWSGFFTEAAAKGIGVHALISGTSATTDYTSLINFAKDNFEGITWDIEPIDVGEMITLMDSFSTVLPQSIYTDAPYYLNRDSGASYADIRTMYGKFDLILLNSYADTLEFAITHANDGPGICGEEGLDYMLGLEVSEYPVEGGIYTLYEEGLEVYRTLLGDIEDHYQSDGYFKGVFTDHWAPEALDLWFTAGGVDRQVASSTDDTREFGSGFFDVTQTWFHTQSYNDTGSVNYRTSGARFLNITVPKDAIIGNGTYIEFLIWSDDDPYFKVHGEAIDNAPTFADAAGEHILDRNLTTAFAVYNGTGVGTGWYGSAIEFKSVVQELVSRPGWASGQAMCFPLIPYTDIDSRVMNAYSYDQAGNVSGPRLHIEYTVVSGWEGKTFSGVATSTIKNINGVALTAIKKVNGV